MTITYQLQEVSLERCRVSRAGVASFLFYHPLLSRLEYEDTLGALRHLETLGRYAHTQKPSF